MRQFHGPSGWELTAIRRETTYVFRAFLFGGKLLGTGRRITAGQGDVNFMDANAEKEVYDDFMHSKFQTALRLELPIHTITTPVPVLSSGAG